MIASKHWTIFKDIDSRNLGMYQERAPDQVIPARRVEWIEIPGRDGALESWDGSYKPYQRTAEYIIRDLRNLSQIASFLTGSGWVTFSDEPDMRSRASIANQADLIREIRQYRRMQVIFDLQPYKYERNPQPILLSASGGQKLETSLYNYGTAFALPVFHITGNGYVDITIQGQSFGVQVGSGITVDCRLQECYNAAGENLNTDMIGNFPSIAPGICPVTIEPEGDAAVTIDPNWRWL